MKLTNKIEKEVLKVYDIWIHSYLHGDVETYDSFLDDEYHFIGSAANEEFLNRKDTTQFFADTGDQFAGKTELRNETKTIEQFGELIFITHIFDGWFLNKKEWNFYSRFRFSSTLRKNKDEWRFIYQHFSIPDSKTEDGETIGYDKINDENQELREAVKRRTFELEQKNRELEIETSLEKVRTIAMGMKEPKDMLEVCKTISQQLQSLGVKEIRNVQTAIFYESRGTYMNYEYYTKHQKIIITDTSYTNNKLHKTFAHQMLKGKDEFFTSHIKGKKIKEWLDYQKTTNVFIDKYLNKASSLNYYWDSLGPVALGISTYVPLNEEDLNLFKRFRNVFELAYTRYLDIEQALAQAREAQVEAALERVRSRSMAMHNSEELKEVIQVLYDQFLHLNINIEHAGFILDYKENVDMHIWLADQHAVFPEITLPYFDSAHWNSFNEAKKKGQNFFANQLGFEEKNKFYKDLFEFIPDLPEETKTTYYRFDGLAISTVLLENIGLYIENYSGIPFSDDENNILMRFGKVFQQTYTRFLDLQKAETQAREAKIEMALEKIRSRTMAMQNSNELPEAANLLFLEVQALGIPSWSAGYIILSDDKKSTTCFMSSEGTLQQPFELPLTEETSFIEWYDFLQSGEQFFAQELGGVELQEHYKYMKSLPELKDVFQHIQDSGLSLPTYQINHLVKYTNGFLLFITYEKVPDAHDIFKRFTKVFEQTYTRFLDLKKAEAQANEAKIEMALEKVRSSTMAMHKSEQLSETAKVLFNQFDILGNIPDRVSIAIHHKENNTFKMWATDQSGVNVEHGFDFSVDEPTCISKINAAWKVGKEFLTVDLSGNDLKNWVQYVRNEAKMEVDETHFKGRRVQHIAFFSYGFLLISYHEPIGDTMMQLLTRFAKVFDQTYTRFLDLQKAERQAIEAQIEAALERVRSRTLAMQHSGELLETSVVVFKQLIELGIEPNRLFIGIIKGKDDKMETWATNEDGSKIASQFTLNATKNKSLKKIIGGWRQRKKSMVIDMKGKELKEYFHYLTTEMKVPFKKGLQQKRRVQTIAYFSKGLIGIASPEEQSQETRLLLERFAAVFNLTYTRFNDLQIAEAQTREAKIETALERVRARALAMQQPEELKEVAKVLRHEMGLLGVEELETCSIYIHDDKSKKTECWYALKEVHKKEKKLVSDHLKMNLKDTWVGREMLAFYSSKNKQTSIVMTGENRVEWIRYCEKHSAPFRGYYGEVIPDRTYHLYKFSHGAMGVATPSIISEESWSLLKRAASVFSLAYSRFKDLTQARFDLQLLKEEKKKAEEALSELQLTQKQLIQSEKMASLGELTAGIAHEIQNPLNFVNNFAEVSNELIDEMNEEIEKGDLEEARAIASDIKQNLEKINHHGKRADAIVKGMLQHSRSSSTTKELTDVNKLADEYLRLAYHGLRAKDKTFNATLKTDYNPDIGTVNIFPQDIGRVILNLITNAFYVVTEKKKQQPEAYEPTVTVSTKKVGKYVEITVVDNGNGIPPKVLDKIFQPFFTTKPTGQGTGLGLSLSYDIVKTHEGELKVNTKEGQGTQFTIRLPK